MSVATVKQERTGWRDLRLSQRHRLWGFNCPALDIDCFIEYDNGEPAALIEYKNERAGEQTHSASYKALWMTAERADLPHFVVWYSSDFSRWTVYPVGINAAQFLSEKATYNEAGYVSFLYRIRGRTMPAEVLRNMELSR